MKHVILFAYIFNIPTVVSAILLLCIYRNRLSKETSFGRMLPFMGALLAATITDMFFYYGDDIINLYIGDLMWLFDDFVYILVALTWMQSHVLMENGRLYTLYQKCSVGLTVFYAISIVALVLSDATYSNVLMIIENAILFFVLLGGAVNVWGLCRTKRKNKAFYLYAIFVSGMFVMDYSLYLLDKVLPYELLFINSAFWLIISLMTITLIVLTLRKQETKGEGTAFQLDTVLDELKEAKNLTKREVDILREIYYGKSNAQIADHFGISENTVKVHVHNLLDKMEAGSRIEAVYMIRKDQ